MTARAPVRVRRAWPGVMRGQVLTALHPVRRARLLRAGFVEEVAASPPARKRGRPEPDLLDSAERRE